jgi:hypothetical protein
MFPVGNDKSLANPRNQRFIALRPLHCNTSQSLRLVYFPRYFDGLRIRSSRSISSSFRAACRRLCLTAFMKVWGRCQASLTSWLIVRQISLIVFTGHDYAIN